MIIKNKNFYDIIKTTQYNWYTLLYYLSDIK